MRRDPHLVASFPRVRVAVRRPERRQIIVLVLQDGLRTTRPTKTIPPLVIDSRVVF